MILETIYGGTLVLLSIAVIWTTVWKAIALWHAARGKQKAWFVVIIIFNTLGLLQIIYLLWFKKKEKTTKKLVVKKKIVRKQPVKKKPAKKVIKHKKK